MTETTPRNNTEPVLWVMSALAAAQILTAGSALTDVVGAKTAALLILIVAAAQTAVQFWVRGAVTATANVVAYVNPDSKVAAGPALVSVDVGKPVAVTPVVEPLFTEPPA